MEEKEHIANVLREAIISLRKEDALALRDLSNRTVHCASCVQDSGSITIAILNYAISKILERNQHHRIKNWNAIIEKIILYYEIAAKELEKDNIGNYERNIIEARRAITGFSDVKQAIKEVLNKASINKASKIYEHGISMGQVSNLLGVTQWELSEYAAQSNAADQRFFHSSDVKKRAEMALEFFK